MCLECGYYNGRQVLDLAKAKESRTARLKATAERRRSGGASIEPEKTETVEAVSTEDTHKEAREENVQTKRPRKKPAT